MQGASAAQNQTRAGGMPGNLNQIKKKTFFLWARKLTNVMREFVRTHMFVTANTHNHETFNTNCAVTRLET